MGETETDDGWLPDDWEEAREYAVLGTLLVGTGLAAVGGVVASMGLGSAYILGALTFAVGVGLFVASLVVGRHLEVIERIDWMRAPEDHADRRQAWTHLKVASMLLQLLFLLVAVTAGISVLARADLLHLQNLPFLPVLRAGALISVSVMVVGGATYLLSLRTRLPDQARNPLNTLMVVSAAAGAVVLTIVAVVLVGTEVSFLGIFTAQTTDAPFFMGAAAAVASAGLFAGRTIPSLYELLTEESSYYRGQAHVSEQRRVMMPALLAVAFLFTIVLLIVVLGTGLAGLVEQAPSNILLLGAVLFAVGTLATAGSFAFVLYRGDERADLYEEPTSHETRIGLAILYGSVIVAANLLVLSFLVWLGRPVLGLSPGQELDLLAFGLMVLFGPYGFYVARRLRRTRRLEERFPEFLRDLAASHRSGLTLERSVEVAAQGDYGELTSEIQTMADQLALNVTFEEALTRFRDRVDTPLVQRSISLILRASKSGGNITDVLLAAAENGREIKQLDQKRGRTMSLYTTIIYITFFVFLAVAAILYASFIPQMVEAQEAVRSQGLSGFGGVSFGSLSVDDFRTFFFMAALVQGVGNGMIAGLVERGDPLLGMRHAFLMVAITWVAFMVLLV